MASKVEAFGGTCTRHLTGDELGAREFVAAQNEVCQCPNGSKWLKALRLLEPLTGPSVFCGVLVSMFTYPSLGLQSKLNSPPGGTTCHVFPPWADGGRNRSHNCLHTWGSTCLKREPCCSYTIECIQHAGRSRAALVRVRPYLEGVALQGSAPLPEQDKAV